MPASACHIQSFCFAPAAPPQANNLLSRGGIAAMLLCKRATYSNKASAEEARYRNFTLQRDIL